ncbi:class I SAM-dependent methyltransferase [Haloechinothrix salitolerans]|uniref:Class I SAM-dependent methyltransferase n=1 Tax=Haloechinothrix salitolerans TaxID=926830 RepID=A0ABW2C858_9PSEU
MGFDATGKVSLDHIYSQPDPRAYFRELRELDYRIPQLAKPYFAKLVDDYRQARQVTTCQIVDIGCSYGINAALLNCDLTMDELYDRYRDNAVTPLSRAELLRQDRELVRARGGLDRHRFIGLDASRPALAYAREAGFLDADVHADLESHPPTERQRTVFDGTDLVISTGCLGYVTGTTLERVITASGERLPWLAHFVLRMFPFDPVADMLMRLGYDTIPVDGVFKQRRFADEQEQARMLNTLAARGVDPDGLETDGWLYAQLYISLPRGERSTIDVAEQ